MFILSWYFFATLLSLYNKWMFDPKHYAFTYPLFVTAWHMVVQFLLALTIRLVWSAQFRPVERPTRGEYVTRITPTATATGADIGLSNLSLKTIDLSLYTMVKSSALIFVLFFAFLFRLEKFSIRLVGVIVLISAGVFMMVFQAKAVNIPGIIMVLCASAIGGLRWALTELIMHKKAMGLSNPFATIFWITPIMGVVLFTVSLAAEPWREIFQSAFFANPLVAIKTIAIIALPGCIAFAMVASEYFVLQRAGVVPLSIAGIFKEVSTITISAWVFGDQLSEVKIVGVVVTICGIALYSFHKYRKSINRDVELDERGDPILREDDERRPLTSERHEYATPADYVTSPTGSGVPLHALDGPSQHVVGEDEDDDERRSGDGDGEHTPASERESERINRLRDEFEGWDSVHVGSDYESEADDDDVSRHREERVGGTGSRWRDFWNRSM
ncbi:hypothetical protein VHUM_03305 [Vanrija humicola]|uniref:Sugar phosphate transporter domain-containing protein n=1 Tax=Vanrija humicola TaxID=5417 RepID=A0A7D8UX53_VANHU|nr:hypothetical protein VHUM_03305 [Vanrija humicola]